MSDFDYEELADMAERGELKPIPGTILHGDEAREAGREALRSAMTSEEWHEFSELLPDCDGKCNCDCYEDGSEDS